MKTLRRVSLGGDRFLGLMKASEWFGDDERFTIYQDYYAVGTWFEFVNTPQSPVIEGKSIVAMTRDLKHADLVYQDLKWSRP